MKGRGKGRTPRSSEAPLVGTRRLRGGGNLVYEVSRLLPLVHLGITLRTGSMFDPVGQEGLSRLTANLLRMGTAKLRRHQVEQIIDGLGGQMSVSVAPTYVHISGVVLTANLEPFVRLLTELIARPALRKGDLQLLKRETRAGLASLCDDDRALVSRHSRVHTFGSHPYGRTTSGTPRTVSSIDREAVVKLHRQTFVRKNVLLSAAGDFDLDHLAGLFEAGLADLPQGAAAKQAMPAPRMSPGRRVLLVDKPERSQTQILISTLGSHARDPDHLALTVANAAFGGLFTSRLTHEVRSVRGWSYGASSSLGTERLRDIWSMWTFPAAADAIACIELQLAMLEQWVASGISGDELHTARSYLAKSYAFEVDTASKRVEQRVDAQIFNFPRDYHDTFAKRIARVTRKQCADAVKRRISTGNLAITVVGTARELAGPLAALPGVSQFRVVPFDIFPRAQPPA